MFIHTRCIVCVWRRCACAERSRPSPLCLLTSRVLNSTSCAIRVRTSRATDVRRVDSHTLFRAIVLSRISAKFSAVILNIFFLFCSIILWSVVLWSSDLSAITRKIFSTSKITHSLLCQKVIRFLLFFLDMYVILGSRGLALQREIVIYNIILYRDHGKCIISVNSSCIDVFECKCVHCS